MQSQTLFAVVVFFTVFSAIGAMAFAAFGNTAKRSGQRIVVERLTQIALVGAAALASLLGRMW